MKNLQIKNCNKIELQMHSFRAGNLSIYENCNDVPFDVKRVFYIYDIPGGQNRGAHAHKSCHQFLVAVSGAFDVEYTNGKQKGIIRLDRPNYGIHIPPGFWAAEKNFSSGAVCLVLTSHQYDESDYIRDYDDYLNYINSL